MSEAISLNQSALDDPWSVPLSELDPSQPSVFQTDSQFGFFERLRAEDPVHYHEDSIFGPYWSITKFNDIMAVDKDHKRFSSDPGITLTERQADFSTPNFISMDPPKGPYQTPNDDSKQCLGSMQDDCQQTKHRQGVPATPRILV